MDTALFAFFTFVSYFVVLLLVSRKVQTVVAKRIRGTRYDLLVSISEIIPLFIGVLIYGMGFIAFGIVFDNFPLDIFLGVLFGAVSVSLEYFWLDGRLLISEEMLRALPKTRLNTVLRRVFALLVLFPISEEIFYRGSIQNIVLGRLGLASIFVSTFLFTIPHLVDQGARQHYPNLKSYIFLIYEGLALGSIIYLTGSLLGCILAHVLMNLLYALRLIRKYLYFNNH
jgi:membrane protease YdiL (CAAX protease family)